MVATDNSQGCYVSCNHTQVKIYAHSEPFTFFVSISWFVHYLLIPIDFDLNY